nr:MAG TPA: hypothetical protein [Caudoviricetes sp.]
MTSSRLRAGRLPSNTIYHNRKCYAKNNNDNFGNRIDGCIVRTIFGGE